jgi:hypothetical protein
MRVLCAALGAALWFGAQCHAREAGDAEVLFSPDDHVTQRLLSEIGDAKKVIHVAVYMLTDKRVAQALIAAHNRGVEVEVVTDQLCRTMASSKASMLGAAGIRVWVFPAQAKAKAAPLAAPDLPVKNLGGELWQGWSKEPIMHHKFAVIDDFVWSGSFNWTWKADRSNQEDVSIYRNAESHKRFSDRFVVLKARSKLEFYAPLVSTDLDPVTSQAPSGIQDSAEGAKSLESPGASEPEPQGDEITVRWAGVTRTIPRMRRRHQSRPLSSEVRREAAPDPQEVGLDTSTSSPDTQTSTSMHVAPAAP